MKKFLLIVLSILLVASMMTIPAFAADDDPVVSQLRGAPGEVVYLTINAGETFEATAIAVAITVPEGLTFVEEESEWLVENEVASVESDKAVMGVASSQYFVGDLLTLAYQVDPEAQEGQEYLVEMTCAAENGTEEVFSIRGNVVVTADSSARELTLNHSAANLDLSVENVLELKAQILPENTKDTLTWTSSNPDVATVENGIVTAHKKGQAIITATVGELSAKCQILVDCSHTNRREIMGKDSTCVEAGYEPYFQCACGPFIYVDGEYVSVTMEQLARPLADHSYVWITDKEATETETGLKHEMCSVCGIERSLGTVIDKLPQSHVHGSLTYHKAVAATCTSAGTKVYYSCSCGQLFADAQAKTPTTLEELTVAKKDHSYQWVVDKEATETATGLKHEECTACKAKRSEGTVIEKLAHVHSGITHHAALAATCVKTGTLEYWTCGGTQCAGKFYGDKNCTKTLSSVAVPVDPKNHANTEVKNAKAATWYAEGYSGDTYCADCDALIAAGKTLAKAGNMPANPFVDVADGEYFHTPVLWAVEKGITNGVSPNSFGPASDCTRAHVVTFLWRAAGSPEPASSENPFVDVDVSTWYGKAVLWAVEKGITNGMGPNTFAPNDVCTRGQVVTFLHRYAGTPAPASQSHSFNDIEKGQFYYNAVLWAVEKGITNGMGEGIFAPAGQCNRGQIVTFLYRFINGQ